ncbi:MAG: phage Gp37/Gp68 family protein [Nitrospirales bacterium]|nr:phage Gp37/Gp68 family protein [Nitrospirales bacterium]
MKTKIEWADMVWNPVRGCSLVSAGCENCYAMKQAHRFAGRGKPYEGLTQVGPHGPRWKGNIRLVPEVLNQPLKIKKPQKIFVNSISDLFHEDVPDEFIEKVFNVMWEAKHHTFQVLTKRPQRMLDFLVGSSGCGAGQEPIPNVWLGVSLEDQKTADERIPLLLQTPAAVRWISAEPLLGPIDVDFDEMDIALEPDGAGTTAIQGKIDWVVVGGESGPKARPMHPDWVRSIRDQCQSAGVPFVDQQWGDGSLLF